MSCTDDLPKWKQLVHSRIKAVGSIQKVADELGYARASLSLALRDKYIGSTERLEQTVIRVLGSVNCPHLGQEITPDQCQAYKHREAPTQNPADMRHWRTCQQCPLGSATRKRIL